MLPRRPCTKCTAQTPYQMLQGKLGSPSVPCDMLSCGPPTSAARLVRQSLPARNLLTCRLPTNAARVVRQSLPARNLLTCRLPTNAARVVRQSLPARNLLTCRLPTNALHSPLPICSKVSWAVPACSEHAPIQTADQHVTCPNAKVISLPEHPYSPIQTTHQMQQGKFGSPSLPVTCCPADCPSLHVTCPRTDYPPNAGKEVWLSQPAYCSAIYCHTD